MPFAQLGALLVPGSLLELLPFVHGIHYERFPLQLQEEKTYTAGQIDTRWTPAIEDDYRAWLKQNEDHLSVSKERVEEILRDHE